MKARSRMSSKAILKAIGCKHLDLWNTHKDYWLFNYDAPGKYDTHSVMCARLNQMTFRQWVDEGRAFAKLCGWVEPVRPPKRIRALQDRPLLNRGQGRKVI